jgi:hypothetical protein
MAAMEEAMGVDTATPSLPVPVPSPRRFMPSAEAAEEMMQREFDKIRKEAEAEVLARFNTTTTTTTTTTENAHEHDTLRSRPYSRDSSSRSRSRSRSRGGRIRQEQPATSPVQHSGGGGGGGGVVVVGVGEDRSSTTFLTGGVDTVDLDERDRQDEEHQEMVSHQDEEMAVLSLLQMAAKATLEATGGGPNPQP